MSDRVKSHFETGWRLFKSRAGVFVVSMLLLFLSWVVLKIAMVMLVTALKSVEGEIPGMGDLFASLERGPAYLLALSMYCLVVSGGFVLLIVPGIYLAIRYCLFAQVITDTSASALAALRKAAALAHGNWAPLGALFLIAFLFNIAGVSLLGIGLIISFPVSLLAIAGFYRSLQPATL